MFNFSQLSIPLIQAPMAGGVNTPDMVAAVANLGGVGSYGFAYSNVEKIAADLAAAKKLRKRSQAGAINANFFVFSLVEMPEQSSIEKAIKALVDVTTNEEVTFQFPQSPFFPDLQAQLEPVWEASPDILTFHFGIPNAAILQRARTAEIAVGITATCVEEAQAIEAAGADFIVAQGREAGGHRGVFNVQQEDAMLPTVSLLHELSAAVNLPLVAAGGIMTRDQIRVAFEAGATAVQMGTAFLSVQESGASRAHKRYLQDQTARGTQLTYGFSGRPARAIRNRFTDGMTGRTVLPFPLQNTLTGELRRRAAADDDGEAQSLWAGENYGECREEGVEELVTRLFDVL